MKWKIPEKAQTTKGKIEKMNNPVSIFLNEFIVKYLPCKETLGPLGITNEFYQTFRKNNVNFINFSQKIE